MGLEMDTGSVKSQLEAMNTELDAVIKNVSVTEAAIYVFDMSGMNLKGDAYKCIREVYSKIHMPILKGIAAYAEALRMQNNTYKSYIDGFLSGIGYVNEDALESDKKCLETQISYVKNAMMTQTGGYSSYLGCLERALEVVKKKLKKIKDFNNSSANLYNGLDSYVHSIKEGIGCIENSTFDIATGTYTLGQSDMVWIKEIEDKCKDRTKIRFYDSLPENLKLYLSIDDFVCTDDGFIMCTQSLEDIFIKSGLDDTDVINTGTVTVSMYDNWYLSGIANADGNYTYTLVKMREPEDEQDRQGSAVSFVALDIEVYDEMIGKVDDWNNLSTQDLDRFYKNIEAVTNGKGDADDNLLEYYKDPASNGSYLIADLFIDKVIKSNLFNDEGNWICSNLYDDSVSYCQDKLDELEKLGIYNKEDNMIHVEDINNFTKDEKSAIMIATTGNPDIYSYAAENQYHADQYGKKWGIFDEHLIVSDAGVGESVAWRLYEKNLKKHRGNIIKSKLTHMGKIRRRV